MPRCRNAIPCSIDPPHQTIRNHRQTCLEIVKVFDRRTLTNYEERSLEEMIDCRLAAEQVVKWTGQKAEGVAPTDTESREGVDLL